MNKRRNTDDNSSANPAASASSNPEPNTSNLAPETFDLTPKTPNLSKVTWGPWAAVIYAIFIFFAAQFMAVLLIGLYPRLRGWDDTTTQAWANGSIYAQFWFVLVAETLTFAAIWKFVRLRKSSLRAIGWRKPAWGDVLYTLAGFFVYFVGYLVLFSLATHLFPSINTDQKQELGFSDVVGNRELVLTFISLVVLPPIVEETVFRGFLFTGLRTKFKPVLAAILTSLLFASAHLQFGNGKPLLWTAAIDTLTLSLVLCYLRHKTDSLWPGIMLHALKNGIAFVSLYLIHAH